MTDARFVELETKMAFQEDLIQKLDDAVANQQQQIFELQTLVKYLSSQIKEVEGQLPDSDAPEPPPPHY